MFFSEINEFRTSLAEIKKILVKVLEKQTTIDCEIESLRRVMELQGQKFESCAEGYKRIQIVCEELTERICDAQGVISNLD